ncbi:MAG: hypothetical protein Ct9H90mP27_3920 [Gammaproteobacteria bacterium]|nr:MAG: hypothetical protein Ct9H90mP27_3920 [Gammaproteobacteria bacterium]
MWQLKTLFGRVIYFLWGFRKGGVLVRSGHTEAGTDLAALAGLPPVGLWQSWLMMMEQCSVFLNF